MPERGEYVIPPDLELGIPVFSPRITILPVVRQILIRTPDSLSGAVSPIALLITHEGETGLAMLDDEISQDEIIGWLKDRGILG
jgi:hypothetical protein